MQEQERLASEEQERRLKAALAASRTNATRVASPIVADSSQPSESQTNAKVSASESKPATPSEVKPNGQAVVMSTQSSGVEDVEMQNVESQIASPNKSSSPWVPELEALFEDVEKIVPKVVIDTLGCVQFLVKLRTLFPNIPAVLVSI
jgi:THO complex subunit 2